MWISDGQNCVFSTSFAKPKVVLYGGFSEFGGLDFEVNNNNIYTFTKISNFERFFKYYAFFMLSSTGVPPIANIE